MKNNNLKAGTKEWADGNYNVTVGCSNNCRYCYAKSMAVRFKRVAESEWQNEKSNGKEVQVNG
jgi:DNA repair photolyase